MYSTTIIMARNKSQVIGKGLKQVASTVKLGKKAFIYKDVIVKTQRTKRVKMAQAPRKRNRRDQEEPQIIESIDYEPMNFEPEDDGRHKVIYLIVKVYIN